MSDIEMEKQEILNKIEDRIRELKEVRQMMVKAQRDYECLKVENDMVRKQNNRLLTSLKDCATELCEKCGKHMNDHLGSCDACKWKDVKNWAVD